MKIKILQGIAGAKEAEGLAVIIDVFRAFSLECYMAAAGAKEIIPVGEVKEAWQWRQEKPHCILVGERGGKIIDGFDYGNSPTQLEHVDLTGKTVIHTTSAGTQGIANARRAEEIITGSLVNAKAIARYIKKQSPKEVSLVCMGLAGLEERQEDTLCGEYIKNLLLDKPMELSKAIENLKYTSGKKFFQQENREIFPERDFLLCTQVDKFDFVLKYVDNRNIIRT